MNPKLPTKGDSVLFQDVRDALYDEKEQDAEAVKRKIIDTLDANLETPEEKRDLLKKMQSINELSAKVSFWSDQTLTEAGLRSWGELRSGGEAQLEEFSSMVAQQWASDHARRGGDGSMQRAVIVTSLVMFSGVWADSAFQRLMTTHTYAAALMCSDTTREILEDVELPWKAFMVILPDGLLHVEGARYNRILVYSCKSVAGMTILDQRGNDPGCVLQQQSRSIADLLFEETEMTSTYTPSARRVKDDNQVKRVVVLSKRLVAGLLLAMQHADNFKTREVKERHAGSLRRSKEPAHRVTMIGKPLTIDLRGEVENYLRGDSKRKNAPPSVQVLVRGHYKRQVIGVGRMGRKVIHIEPYWRGPDDAPIFTRPKRLGGPS